MINITRGERPISLDNPEIKQYLEDVIAYKALTEAERKIIKKPEVGTYRTENLLEAFDRDFYAKCYLTEQKFENSWAMDIEHFRSKAFGQYPELRYEWTNLYPCSHDANMMKSNTEPLGGYLDPCDAADDVEKEIVYTWGLGGKFDFDSLNPQNPKALNTAKLLDKVHNGTDKNSTQKTATLRKFIADKVQTVTELIMEWLAAGKDGNKEEEVKTSRKLKNILSRKSDYTMLLRSQPSVKKYVPKDFLD